MVEFAWPLAAALAASGATHAVPPAARAGAQGAQLSATAFTWCGGALTVELDRWADQSGMFSVYGWSYLYWDSHSSALRVDGNTTYVAHSASGAKVLTTVELAADDLADSARIVHEAAGVARVTTRLRGTEVPGCCALHVETEVRNLDWRAHSFEWRWFHDTAYKEYVSCPKQADPDVDGGEVCLPGEVPGVSCRRLEFDALAEGAVGCGRSMTFHSAETGLAGPTFVFDDTLDLPETAEVLVWEADAREPVLAWSGFVDGEDFSGCSGDNALLAAWRIPPASGQLAQDESGRLRFSIGQGCAPACCALGADAGPGGELCQGESLTLGASPVASGGIQPFRYAWTPDDGTLSDPAAEHPVATPSTDRIYQVEVEDAAGCTARSMTLVTVRPDGVPASAMNSLRAIRAPAALYMSWQTCDRALTYSVRGDDEKSFTLPAEDQAGLLTTSTLLPAGPEALRFYRVAGVSCSGIPGP